MKLQSLEFISAFQLQNTPVGSVSSVDRFMALAGAGFRADFLLKVVTRSSEEFFSIFLKVILFQLLPPGPASPS